MAFKLLHRSFSSATKNVVVVDGCRIPFSLSSTIYNDLLAVDLAAMALRGLVTQTALDTKLIDYIYYGNVIQECRTSNIAREASMAAGYPKHIPSSTVAQACISANQAICSGAEKILSGQADIIVAGGAETFSDVPIRFSRTMRQNLIKMPKVAKQGPIAALKHFSKFRFQHLKPELPAIANYTTGEVMGVSSDRLSARFGVSRADQDRFALRSHHLAAQAHAQGLYKDEIIPVKGTTTENGVKGESTYEKISSLSPAFLKPHGTHTAANSSFLTDGASAILIMSEEKALQLGYKPKSYIRSWTFSAVDPFEDLLLGPTFAANQVLQNLGLTLEDIGVVELHEAFAGQVLSNLTAMNSDKFANEYLNGKKVGEIKMDIMNTLGGSLSLGHPFGATGARLVTTASNRLQREGKRFALLAACADGGLGHACILERYDNK